MSANATKNHARAINLRMRDEVRDLIDRAAHMSGRSRSDFMVEAARRAAEEALLDQTLVHVGRDAFSWHLEILDRPPSGVGYERLMAAKTPWQV